jgi:hypothetical protein
LRKPDITIDELKAALSYEPETGTFRWKQRKAGVTVGMVAGSVNDTGYRSIKIGGRSYFAHHLAWAYIHGEWPAADMDMDHINLQKDDNRIANLRIATTSMNNANRAICRNNTSGRKGVTWNKQAGKWMAQIRVNGQRKYLGLFSDLDSAHAAYVRAANHNFKEFARSA